MRQLSMEAAALERRAFRRPRPRVLGIHLKPYTRNPP